MAFVNRLDTGTDRSWRAARREKRTESRAALAADAFLQMVAGGGTGKAGTTDVVFVIDETTDSAFLTRTLEEAWTRVRADSPNRSMRTPEARLLRVRAGALDVRKLLKALFGAGVTSPG